MECDPHPFARHSPFRYRWKKVLDGGLHRFWATFGPAHRAYRVALKRLEIGVVEVPIRRLPEAFRGYTIAYLSDIHAGSFLRPEDLVAVARRVSALRPDLIALGGDLINYHEDELDALVPALRHLEARDGLVAVPGNHEYYAEDPRRLFRRLAALGPVVLVNDAFAVRRGDATLWILGVDDGERGRFDLDAALRPVENGDPKILLSHQPDALPLAAERGIDLVLSGHTHGGQFRFPFVGALVHHTKYGYVGGLYRKGETLLYVGRGVGAAVVPFRLNCPPEVPLIRLVPA
ncbi:MAG TPA: metallophosphoesterase [Planctomycetota bacterium]|nr:metallophosphoesterase [Planctomycetota bacterium]